MKPETWLRIREVFEGALALAETERPGFLTSSCAGEPEVRREVERLLREDSSATGFLEPLSAEIRAAAIEPGPHPAGSRIGPFEVRRVLASGGMGTVYEARQEGPHRVVALKTMRAGFGTEAQRRRFELEAEVLGSLLHPGIAQIYASGTHAEGGRSFPYFAMEYVEGARDLLHFARGEGLTLRQRVELFVRVCDAVRHGHAKGVVHRDLKPGNLLVDGEGRPKVIDFGVARTTAPSLAAAAVETQEGQLVGTLQYMSPEQLTRGEADTRSDVYALGCVLYELLTGTLPYDLGDKPLSEVTRLVAEVEPRRPTELPGDLGWILLNCLAKDPERRFASAAELRADLQRYLRNEPVLAGPPSAGYRLRKFGRRNRVFLASTAAVVAALAIGLLQARREAEAATAATEVARRAAAKAEGVSGFLRSMLTSVGPLSHGRDTRVLDVLVEATDSLERELQGQPEARAMVQNVLGETYSELRMFDPAWLHLDAAEAYVRSLAPDDPLRLDVMTNRARLTILAGRPAEAEDSLRELETLASGRLGEEHRLTLRIQGTLSELLLMLDKLDEAEERYEAHLEAMERVYGPSHGEVIGVRGGRALVWRNQGRLAEARVELERTLALAVEHLPADHFRIMNAKMNLATCYSLLGDHEQAERLAREQLADMRRTLGDQHPLVLPALGNLGVALMMQGRSDEALPYLDEALALALDVYGEDTAKAQWAR